MLFQTKQVVKYQETKRIYLLVRKYPNLIAGYNTMTAEQKKNVDVKGLSNFMCRSLCVIAVLMIVSYFVMVARAKTKASKQMKTNAYQA